MNRMTVVVILTTACLAGTALAQDEAPASAPAGRAGNWAPYLEKGLAGLAVCLGAALIIFGGAKAIGTIGSHAVEAIARQPEASSSMFLAWLFPAAMIEGAMMFGLVICLMAMNLLLRT